MSRWGGARAAREMVDEPRVYCNEPPQPRSGRMKVVRMARYLRGRAAPWSFFVSTPVPLLPLGRLLAGRHAQPFWLSSKAREGFRASALWQRGSVPATETRERVGG